MTPRRYQSGEIDRSGRISTCCDPLLRTYLFEGTYLFKAAGILLNRVSRGRRSRPGAPGSPRRWAARRPWWRSPVTCL
ncbi:hypothetical protein [Microvirga sp. TS319]|uniref:transposase n=1 Tax=Microvirga sp. TS319 TaxID=3241165 RepID=UPI00351A2F26